MAGRPTASKQIVATEEILQIQQIKDEVWRLTTLIPALMSQEDCIRWLAKRRLIKNSVLCCYCWKPASLVAYRDGSDGKRWSCRSCNFRQSIRHGSFFDNSHLSLSCIVRLVYLWTMDLPQDFIIHECGTNPKTMVDWCNFCRNECTSYVQRHSGEIGGMDDVGRPIVVDIYETEYFQKKCNGDQRQEEGHWIFGGIERGSGKCFLAEMEDRLAATLEAKIQQYILPGSRIVSDGWAAYANIGDIGCGVYSHDVVIHTAQDFGDPVDWRINRQSMAKVFMRAKRKLKHQFGTSRALFPSYLHEFIFRNAFRGRDIFGQFLACLAENYAV